MANVVLINAFEVPSGKEEEFLQGWEEARDFMQVQKGDVATRLHRSLDPGPAFALSTSRSGQQRQSFRRPLHTRRLRSCGKPAAPRRKDTSSSAHSPKRNSRRSWP